MSKADLKGMLEGMRETLERDQAAGKLAGLTVSDLAEAISHPKAPEVIAECMEADAASVKLGEPAPDFSLPWLPGSREGRGECLTLSEHFEKPVHPAQLVIFSYRGRALPGALGYGRGHGDFMKSTYSSTVRPAVAVVELGVE